MYQDFQGQNLNGNWNFKLEDYLPDTDPQGQSALPEQPMPSPQVVGSRPQAPGVMQSGLTPSETALLSDEEKMIRLRQRGLA